MSREWDCLTEREEVNTTGLQIVFSYLLFGPFLRFSIMARKRPNWFPGGSSERPLFTAVVGGWRTGWYEEIGARPSLEDRVVSQNLKLKVLKKSRACLFAVFDGHAGEEAAVYLQKNLPGCLESSLDARATDIPLASESMDAAVKGIITEAFTALDHQLCGTPSGISGSCATTVLVLNSRMYCANLGDSRVVVCRGGQALPLSEDHKPTRPDEKERIKAAGGFVARGRVLGCLAVSRAFGDRQFKLEHELRRIAGVDEGDAISPVVVATPEIKVDILTVQDEFILLACDGLFDVMSNQECCDFVKGELASHGDPHVSARNLASHAVIAKGSTDNVSVLVVLLKEPKLEHEGMRAAEASSELSRDWDTSLTALPPPPSVLTTIPSKVQSVENSEHCFHCRSKFTVMRRRHHCRSCWHSVCDSCSRSREVVAGSGSSEPSRVCTECATGAVAPLGSLRALGLI